MAKYEDFSSPESNTSYGKEVCVFYKRIGACRHNSKCSRLHIPPERSRTIMIRNLYRHVQPVSAQIASTSPDSRALFEGFYEEVFTEIDEAYGKINQMHVCENMGEHLIGNVYIKFYTESSAERAMTLLNNRYFAGFPIFVELSPVEDFRDAVCRQHDAGDCIRGGFCNFLHIKHISHTLENRLYSSRSASPSSASDFSASDSYSDNDSFYNSASSYSDSESMVTETSFFSSTSTESTNESGSNDDDEATEKEETLDDSLPRAFRIKPLEITDIESSTSSDDDEVIDRHQQVSRRLRWEIYRQRLEGTLEWNDEAERQYVFNLLELA